jgi:hypothetical protein
MMKETVLSRSVRMICVAGMAMSAQVAFAQEAASRSRTESANYRFAPAVAKRRIANPLQILTSADIAASGAVNLQDLLQKNQPWVRLR